MATVIGDLVVKIGADIDGLKKGVDSAKGKLDSFADVGEKLTKVGTTMSTYVTAPILAAGAAAIASAAQIDKGVGEIVTLFGLTGTEATKMSDKLKTGIATVSNELGIAQEAITGGLYNAISAGVPEENVFDFMTVAAKASVAGVTDINTAVDGITTSINAYGLSASDAQRVSDSMFAAVQGGKTTFAELSGALFNVAPAAAAAGVSMEEINAGIATLTASGVPTSVATTQLRAALSGLQRPSEDLDKIFQSLGYQSAQVAIESEGLGFALDAVKKASNGNNGELQNLLGSVEAVSAANIIAGTGAEKFADELDRQANSAGLTEAAFNVMAETTSMKFQKAMTTLQNIGISLGEILLPFVNGFLEAVQGILGWFAQLDSSTKTVILTIAGIVAAIGPLLLIVGKISTAFAAVGTAVTAAGGVMGAFSGALAVITGPIGIAVAAAVALAGIGVLIYNNWDKLNAWFKSTFAGTITSLQAQWRNLTAAVDTAWKGIKSIWDQLSAAFDSIFGSNGMSGELSLLTELWELMSTNVAATIGFLVTTVSNTFGSIIAIISGVIGSVSRVISAFLAALRGDWSGAWANIKEAASAIWNALVTVVINGVDTLLSGVGSFLQMFPGMGDKIDGMRERIRNMVPTTTIESTQKLSTNLTTSSDKAVSLGTAAETGTDKLKQLGQTGAAAGTEIATAMSTAFESIKSLDEQVGDIIGKLGVETEMGKRVLAFTVELNRKTELQNEIKNLEQALTQLAKETTIDINDQRVVDLQIALDKARIQLQDLNSRETFQKGLEASFSQLATVVRGITGTELKLLSEGINGIGTIERTPESFKTLTSLSAALSGMNESKVFPIANAINNIATQPRTPEWFQTIRSLSTELEGLTNDELSTLAAGINSLATEAKSAEYYAAIKSLENSVVSLDKNAVKELHTSITNLAAQAKTPEDMKSLLALEKMLATAKQSAIDIETEMDDFFALADSELAQFEAVNNLYLAFDNIDTQLSGEAALQAKISAVWAAVGNGTVPLQTGEDLVADLNTAFGNSVTATSNLKTAFDSIVKTHFPSFNAAINSGKSAVVDFKNAFNGSNGKPFLENLSSGFDNVGNAINSTKSLMNEFGVASGLVLTGLNAMIPGFGAALTGLKTVFEALGIDVSGALNKISDAIERLIRGPQQLGPIDAAIKFFNDNFYKISDLFYLSYGVLPKDVSVFTNAISNAVDYEEFIANVAEALNLTIEQVENIFAGEIEKRLKSTVFAGMYDPETGKKSGVSPELKAQIMAMMEDMLASGNFTNQEILDALIARFTRTPLITLGIAQMLGLPALAKGGLAFGETMAIVGDNMNARIDPEVISPLSKLREMLVEPTLAAIGNIGQTSKEQHIYVMLEGGMIAYAVARNMPDVIRMNTGVTY